MSEAPPPKKMKQTDTSLSLTPEAETKTFMYHSNSETYSVVCDTSMTVLDALNTNDVFRSEREKPKNIDKEILIERKGKEVPRAAVKTDFPVCLIENEEIIDVNFFKNDGSNSMKQKTPEKQILTKSDIVTFFVKKKGGDKVNCILKSKALRSRVEYVCVYAHKDEKLKKALKSDGRFKDDMFKKHCALSEFGTENRHLMSDPVKHLDQKIFKVVVLKGIKQPDSQDDLTPEIKTEPGVASDADVADGVVIGQNPENTKQDPKHKNNPVKSTRTSAKRSEPKVIPDTEEILGILCNQFKGLLEKLKERENLKNKSQVQNFFRGKFAKSVENFLEVKKVKMLAKLSDSVCQIRVEGKPEGTGFLLFDRFILTNAHVIEPFTEHSQGRPYPWRLQKTVKTIFNFDDYQSAGRELSVKKEIFALANGTDSKGRYLDYALLVLETEAPADLPKLSEYCGRAPPRDGSQICIVGHPGEGVKKVDPCVIIHLEDEQRSMNNPHCVITQQYFEGNKITYDSCFSYGSSGSPVFDEHCYLIGVHTGFFTHQGKVIEYAFSLEPILENIKLQAEERRTKESV